MEREGDMLANRPQKWRSPTLLVSELLGEFVRRVDPQNAPTSKVLSSWRYTVMLKGEENGWILPEAER